MRMRRSCIQLLKADFEQCKRYFGLVGKEYGR